MPDPVALEERRIVDEHFEVPQSPTDRLLEAASAGDRMGVVVLTVSSRLVQKGEARSAPPPTQLDVLFADVPPVLVEHEVPLDG
jgi:hypothetical protein